jgi:hypothetical protein
MIERRRNMTLSGVPSTTLDPVDNLIALAFHAARSDGHRLVWLKDIERAIAVDPADPAELVARAREAGVGPPVGLMLQRACGLLGADVPADVVGALVPRGLAALDRLALRVGHPIQPHDRPTFNRFFTRSVRSSTAATIVDVPARAARRVARRLNPPAENETDDPLQKARFLAAVANSTD